MNEKTDTLRKMQERVKKIKKKEIVIGPKKVVALGEKLKKLAKGK